MRATVLAVFAASVLFSAFAPFAAADVAIPVPQLHAHEERVALSAYWCPVLLTSGGPAPCGPREEILVFEAGTLVARPVCIDRVADEAACALTTPFVAIDEHGPVVRHPLLP